LENANKETVSTNQDFLQGWKMQVLNYEFSLGWKTQVWKTYVFVEIIMDLSLIVEGN